jgi:hypothetical protein
MTEHPLLLSSPMVLSTLAGRKTVTRRILSKRNTLIDGNPWGKSKCKWEHMEFKHPESSAMLGYLHVICSGEGGCGGSHNITPIYQPGDVVWFRESIQPLLDEDFKGTPNYKTGEGYAVHYPATDGIIEFYDLATDNAFCSKVTPSIHMPRWASRLVCPVIGSRIEYLQSITEEDAVREGVMLVDDGLSPVESFMQLWDSLNEDRENGIYAWPANPLVIRLEFGSENVCQKS